MCIVCLLLVCRLHYARVLRHSNDAQENTKTRLYVGGAAAEKLESNIHFYNRVQQYIESLSLVSYRRRTTVLLYVCMYVSDRMTEKLKRQQSMDESHHTTAE